jgi:hypothetical protein
MATSGPLAGTLAEQGLQYAGDRRDLTWMRLAAHRVLFLEAINPELSMLATDTPLRREVCRRMLALPGSVPPRIEADLFIFDSRAEAIELGSHLPGVRLCWIGDYRGALPLYRTDGHKIYPTLVAAASATSARCRAIRSERARSCRGSTRSSRT